MQSQPYSSRKRAAPGKSPAPAQQNAPQPGYQQYQMPDNNDYSNFDFAQAMGGDASYTDPSGFDANAFAQQLTAQNAHTQPSQSTDLVRIPRNQQLAPQAQEQWNGYSTNNTNGQSGDEDEHELDMKVQMAKRDAQGKRKQIPPFVQKLSSFLDSNNTELIRWSDDGRSFIVLDEDEFARTLIPELFKHNNYASFVRQLNMYGFHKTVNITDGSLRQSEKARKGVKPPSMYSHPYFRKNRPDLLWLIQKPTGKTSAKRKRDGAGKTEFDSDDERLSPAPEGRPQEVGHAQSAGDLAHMPRTELVAVRTELQKLQQQQKFISKMIAQLKEQNDHFYRQASTFQALHDRHENSINAILTFLATFYNRSLDGNGAQNLMNMFNNSQNQNNQQHGSVVEEYQDPQTDNNQVQRYKRPPLLLPAGPSSENTKTASPQVATAPNSARGSVTPPDEPQRVSAAPTEQSRARTTASPAIKTDAPTPDYIHQTPENDQMMSLINGVNASTASTPNQQAPSVEFNSALNHFQNAGSNGPLTPQQRNDMLSLIANQQGDANNNNALISPQPPTMPDLNQLKQTQQQLDMLTNMQKQQDSRVQELNRRLQPLSPTGSIPGVGSGDENPFDIGAPGDYDPNAFVNFDDWGEDGIGGPGNDINFDFSNANDGNDIDWDFGNAGDSGADMFKTSPVASPGMNAAVPAQGKVESIEGGSEGTTPSTSQDVDGDTGDAPRKKQRRR